MPAFNSFLGSSQATHLFRSQLGFEAYLMVYLMACFLLQNINLYKTNIRSLDVGLLVFTSVFLSRRLSLTLFRKILESFKPGILSGGGRALTCHILKVVILVILLAALIWSLVLLVRKASIFDCLFLFYPFILYLSLFGFTLYPTVHREKLFSNKTVYVQFVHSPKNVSSSEFCPNSTTPTGEGPSVLHNSLSSLQEEMILLQRNHRLLPSDVSSCRTCRDGNNGKLTRRKGESHEILTNGISHDVYHSKHNLIDLPASPEEIRTEVESLLQDVISRVKQLLFNSVVCTYYTIYIPLQFVEGHIFYDRWWCVQQGIIVWCTCFVLMASQLLPPAYCSSLNKLAVNCLGVWSRESCDQSVPEWSGRVAWSKDTVVRWDGEMFRADNPVNVAIPGNSSHEYFFHLFQSKVYVYTWLLALEGIALLMLLISLYKSHFWHQYISAAVLLALNYYLFYKLLFNRLSLRTAVG